MCSLIEKQFGFQFEYSGKLVESFKKGKILYNFIFERLFRLLYEKWVGEQQEKKQGIRVLDYCYTQVRDNKDLNQVGVSGVEDRQINLVCILEKKLIRCNIYIIIKGKKKKGEGCQSEVRLGNRALNENVCVCVYMKCLQRLVVRR